MTEFFMAAAALALLYFGGESLVRGSSTLARKMGISQLAIGLSVVAFGTSAPELVVSLNAALTGANDISVGNVVGSNIANVALILGLAALIRPLVVEAKVIRLDAPIMILVSFLLLGLVASGTVSRPEGIILVLSLFAYVAFTYVQSRRETDAVRSEFTDAARAKETRPAVSVLQVVAGLALLIAGGHLLVQAAVSIAASFGVSQAVIGLTIVAVGTSLPELATSIIATVRGQNDIAVGNVVGSNIFNILGILGVTATVRPLQLGGISWIDLAVMTTVSCALLPILFTGHRIGRGEGVLLLAAYVMYTGYLLV